MKSQSIFHVVVNHFRTEKVESHILLQEIVLKLLNQNERTR